MSLPKNKTLHRTFKPAPIGKLCDNAAVCLEGGADRDHAWEESDASLGGENVNGSRDVWGTRLPDSKSHFQQGRV